MTGVLVAGVAGVAVAAGAAIGAPLRYLIDRWVTGRTTGRGPWSTLPWGLLAVNASGSLLAGLVLVWTGGLVRTLLLTGFCGALTTFSGFGWETVQLWRIDRRMFWLAVIVLPAVCLAAFWLGWAFARATLG